MQYFKGIHTVDDIPESERAAFREFCEFFGEPINDRSAHNYLLNRRGLFGSYDHITADLLKPGETAEGLLSDSVILETDDGRALVCLQYPLIWHSNGHDAAPSLTGLW